MTDGSKTNASTSLPGWLVAGIERAGVLGSSVAGALVLTALINAVAVVGIELMGLPGYSERSFGGAMIIVIPLGVSLIAFYPLCFVVDRLLKAEAAAERSAEKFRALADGSIQGICIQRNFLPLYCNRAYAEIFGFDSPEHVYRFGSQASLAPRPLREGETFRPQGEKRNLLSAGSVFPARRLDGSEIWVEAAVREIDWDGAPAVQITVIDVDERRRVEEIKNEFVSMVSHELRTPLTAVEGSLSMIDAGMAGEIPPEARKLIRIAASSSNRLVRLINDILDLGRIESGAIDTRLVPLNAHAVLRQAIEAITPIAYERGVAIDVQRTDDDALILGDRDQLIQVLTNLLSNAIKFSPANGHVRAVLRRHGNFVRFDVSDDGPGIPDEFRGRIFQRFSRAHSGKGASGTGLGLAIAKLLVERHFGTIGFESKAGHPTTFFVDLPERRRDAA